MAAPFAAVEARINAAVVRHLANATAIFGGGAQVDVEFTSPYAESFGIAAGSAPMARGLSSSLSGVAMGAAVTINGAAYTVSGIEPDGTGMTLLRLDKA